MTRITILQPSVASPVMQEAFRAFDKWLGIKKRPRPEGGLSAARDIMNDPTLSDWFAFGIHFIFERIYIAEDSARNAFLDEVQSMTLNRFSREYHAISKLLEGLRRQQLSFFSKSHTNLPAAFLAHEEMLAEIKRLECLCSKKDILALFLIITKVVSLLESQAYLTLENAQIQKERLIQEPCGFLQGITSILMELQNISPNEEAQIALKKIDRAIHATLKLLNFSGDNDALVFLLRDDLVEKKFINLVEDVPGAVSEVVSEEDDVPAESESKQLI